MNKVVSIIVTFNRLNILKNNLSYIKAQKKRPDFILIVNNGSDDGTKLFLDNHSSEYSSLHLNENLGYGAGLAEGIAYSFKKWDPDFFWLMDDDSFPNTEVLHKLFLKSKEIDLDGILGITGFNLKYGIPRKDSTLQEVSKVDFVLVDNALLSKSAVSNGFNFRKDLFMMCEDYEFCARLNKIGYFVGVYKNQDVNVERQHLGSQKDSKSLIWRGYYHSRNLFLILKEDFSWLNFFFYFYRQLKHIIHSLLFGKNKLLRTKYRIIGIWDGFRGIAGKTIDPASLKRIKSL